MTKKLKSISSLSLIILLTLLLFILIIGFNFTKVKFLTKITDAASVVTFPKDHRQHPNFNSEWWYINLLTKTINDGTSTEKDLAYVISFSRIMEIKSLLSSRYDQGTKSFKEATNTGGDLQVSLMGGEYLKVQYSNGSTSLTLREMPSIPGDMKRVYKLIGKTNEIGTFDLTLKERSVGPNGVNTPLLWGENNNCSGRISVFNENDTFYYSIPDLDITGTITDIDGIKSTVKIGKAWIDHQWFNGSPPSNWRGHYWTSLHYTNSNNLYDSGPHSAFGFVTQIYDTGPKYTYWVKRNSNGTNECGTGGNITIDKYGSTNFPSSWNIKLDEKVNMFSITGSSFSDNQIVNVPGNFDFLEASSYFSGLVDGNKVTGLGFFETHIKK